MAFVLRLALFASMFASMLAPSAASAAASATNERRHRMHHQEVNEQVVAKQSDTDDSTADASDADDVIKAAEKEGATEPPEAADAPSAAADAATAEAATADADDVIKAAEQEADTVEAPAPPPNVAVVKLARKPAAKKHKKHKKQQETQKHAKDVSMIEHKKAEHKKTFQRHSVRGLFKESKEEAKEEGGKTQDDEDSEDDDDEYSDGDDVAPADPASNLPDPYTEPAASDTMTASWHQPISDPMQNHFPEPVPGDIVGSYTPEGRYARAREVLQENLAQQAQTAAFTVYLSNDTSYERNVDVEADQVAKESNASKLAWMLGTMRKDMHKFSAPFYLEYLEQTKQRLKAEEPQLEHDVESAHAALVGARTDQKFLGPYVPDGNHPPPPQPVTPAPVVPNRAVISIRSKGLLDTAVQELGALQLARSSAPSGRCLGASLSLAVCAAAFGVAAARP